MSDRTARVTLLALVAGCAAPAGDGDRDADPAVVDGPPAAGDAALADGATCPDLGGEFTLDRLDTHSNVCVDRATCAFSLAATGGCGASVTCSYQGAGTETAELEFTPFLDGWTASFVRGERAHEFVLGEGGMAYRIRGDLSSRHLCTFSDGPSAPVFPVSGAGDCPDLTRTFRLFREDVHLCSDSLRCGAFQDAADACRVDAFCTYPTGESVSFAALTVSPGPGATSGLAIGDATSDPRYPARFELGFVGDFATGVGPVTAATVDYFFNQPADPTCSWVDP